MIVSLERSEHFVRMSRASTSDITYANELGPDWSSSYSLRNLEQAIFLPAITSFSLSLSLFSFLFFVFVFFF